MLSCQTALGQLELKKRLERGRELCEAVGRSKLKLGILAVQVVDLCKASGACSRARIEPFQISLSGIEVSEQRP